MATNEQNKKGKLQLILYLAIFLFGIFVLLSVIAWQVFSFDPFGIFAGMGLFADKYPTLFLVVMLVYFSFAISRHWVAYKKTHRETDLGWMIILSIWAVILAIAFVINLF